MLWIEDVVVVVGSEMKMKKKKEKERKREAGWAFVDDSFLRWEGGKEGTSVGRRKWRSASSGC